jgi:hypothetical protein
MAGEFRAFLSAVTSEFGMARDAVANDLQARGLQLRVQRSFRQEPGADTLLRLLHDYIRECSAVVCVIGARSGACPSPAAAAAFTHLLPPGITEASYTQWEFFLARAYQRRLSLYIAAADYQPDREAPSGDDLPELQDAFIGHIKAAGLHYVAFLNRDQLRAEVLKEPRPEEPRAKPIVLPYPSLGSLFKGREAFLRQLRRSLTRAGGGTTAIVSKALYGMGGIGKTRAAVEYAWAYREDYTALLFAQADSPEELRRNLAGLAGPLQLSESAAAEEEVRLNAVLSWLGANPGWLLILDNIDTPQPLAEAAQLIGRLAGGHIVITTRLANFPAAVEPFVLGVLDTDDAADFLLERTARHRRAAADDEVTARQQGRGRRRGSAGPGRRARSAGASLGAGGGDDRQIALRLSAISRNLAEQPREGGRLGKARDHRIPPCRRCDVADLGRSAERSRAASARAARLPRPRPGADVPAGHGCSRRGGGGSA